MRFLFLLLLLAGPAFAEPPDRQCSSGRTGVVHCIREAHFVFDLCQLIEATTQKHGLNTGFFTRLIWQESRFDPNALSHANAQGIAQFIPSTAKLRNLPDPFNPADALVQSAVYLAELTARFGNEGLAAVAYNGGETRAEKFKAKSGGLARETIDYVEIITGLPAEDWRDAPPKAHDFSLSKTKPFRAACYDLARNRVLTKFKPTQPKVKPWGVQLAAGSTRAKAQKSYRIRSRACKSVLKGRQPDYIRKKPQVAARKPYVAARIGANSRVAAQKLCNKLRRYKCACAVYKN